MSLTEEQESFRDLLNNEYDWPARYTFKFIVKTDYQQQVKNIFPQEAEFNIKPSSGDKYVSVTVQSVMKNAAAIIEIYESASVIPGIISL